VIGRSSLVQGNAALVARNPSGTSIGPQDQAAPEQASSAQGIATTYDV